MTSPLPTTSSTTPIPPSIIQILSSYTACDISDALVTLQIPGAGFLPSLHPISTRTSSSGSSPDITIAPASTITFIPKHALANYLPGNIPQGTHWSDLTVPGTIAVMVQPEGQSCAVLGGINAARMRKLGAVGAVVCGRVRDVGQLKKGGLVIWASGTSTVGTGLQSVAHDVQVPIDIPVASNPKTTATVSPGDVVFSDSVNGVVVIPQKRLEDVVRVLPGLVEADEKCLRAVEEGMAVGEAFGRFRGKRG